MPTMNTVWGKDHLERQIIWSEMIKEALQDDLDAQKYVRWIPDFGGGELRISSIGEFTVDDIQEEVPIPTSRPDTGQFKFVINQAKGNKAAYTDEFLEDDFLAPEVVNATPVKMKRALDEVLETEIFKLHRNQVVNDGNIINTKRHRYVASGTGNVIALEDFAYAKLALKKANVPMTNLVAIVPPEVGFRLETMTNIVNVSNNPQWEGIVTSGLTTGMRFIRNIYGFDVYESNYLDLFTETNTQYDGTGSVTLNDAGACLFFSAAGGDVAPFIGSWRRMPTVESWRDHDKRTEYHQLTCRFGLGLYRPENLVTVLANDVNVV